MTGITQRLRDMALESGFDLFGIAPAAEAPRATGFRRWIDAGYHADMLWLERNAARRLDPRHVVPGARSVLMVGFSYFVETPPRGLWDDPLRGRIARYAWGVDYHDLLLPKLLELKALLMKEASGGVECKAYIDTGPLLEKSWAEEAGLGFIGKNTLLIHPAGGSFYFLGGIITNQELESDTRADYGDSVLRGGSCGACRRCVDICPTHAFPAPYILDSARCISYLTIERKVAIPEPMRPLLGNWIFGCDACQEICPWVKRYSKPASTRFLSFDPVRHAPDLQDLMGLNDAAFRQRYRGTPIMRAKRRGLLRNAAVALGNSGQPEVLPVLRKAADDPEPMIREHAQWAIARLEG